MILGLLITFFNKVIEGIATLANYALFILPNSPFKNIEIAQVPYLSTLNWFIPFDLMLVTLIAWTGAISIFYIAMILLRWVKAIR